MDRIGTNYKLLGALLLSFEYPRTRDPGEC
jgi:hypothetical protein